MNNLEKNENIVRYTMEHINPENQSNTMNSTWKNGNAMNISEEKTMSTLKLKQIKQIKTFNKTM